MMEMIQKKSNLYSCWNYIFRTVADKNYTGHDIINELTHLITQSVLRQVISATHGEFYPTLVDNPEAFQIKNS